MIACPATEIEPSAALAQSAFLHAAACALSSRMPHAPAHRFRRRPGWFRPVPLRSRRDGWSAERQCAFLTQLYLTGSVTAAARAVGMSRASLAKLQEALTEARLNPETSGKGYSVGNINSRIKLYFGKEYGLHYSSEEGVGTRVEVILPVNWTPASPGDEDGRIE